MSDTTKMVLLSFKKSSKCSVFFILAAFSFLSAKSQIEFLPLRYDSAKVLAIKKSKLLLVDFRADWCRPCVEMEKSTFTDTSLASYINPRYIAIKAEVDSSYNSALKSKYQVNQYPTILAINPHTDIVELRLVGFKTASILLGDLKMIERTYSFILDEEFADDKHQETDNQKIVKSERRRCFIKRWFKN